MNDIERIHIKITKELKQKIKTYAKSKGISVSALIRMAIINEMEKR